MLRYPGQRFEEILSKVRLYNGTVFIQKNCRMTFFDKGELAAAYSADEMLLGPD
jgi:hypothetical protein